MSSVPGFVLGEVLGHGAGGTVFAARRSSDVAPASEAAEDTFAVKVVRGEGVDAWLHESRTASAVDHPGVVSVLDSGCNVDDESAYGWIVMPRLSGPDLSACLRDGPMPSSRAADLAEQVARALHAVHRAGVVHADLKPANVVLDGTEPVIVDFGAARRLTADVSDALAVSMTASSGWVHSGGSASAGATQLGTYPWMAPEQWRGEKPDVATDVYGLGAVLFALLTGRPPHDGRTLIELARQVAVDDVPPPSRLGAVEIFDDVVRTAMARDPEQRFVSAEAFADAVAAARAGRRIRPADQERVDSVAPVPDQRPTSLRRGRRWAAIATTVGVVGALGAAALWAGVVIGERGSAATGAVTDGTVLTVCAEREATMRDSPKSPTVVETLPRGTHVTAVNDDRNSPVWVKARTDDGVVGFVLTQFVHRRC